MALQGATVTLEPPEEYQVQEITYDGQEKYIQPLSMPESLSRSVQRIEFTRDKNLAEDSLTSGSGGTAGKSSSASDDKAFQATQQWPWESVRNKLRSAFVEIQVLHDVLQVARDKRYMVLDAVSATQDSSAGPAAATPQEARPITQLLFKKKACASASILLMQGAEKLKSMTGENTFQKELAAMRSHWRLKKLGNVIVGDLSYRSAGSRYPNHPVQFEVTKNESAPDQPAAGPATPSSKISALKVHIPSELRGSAYIKVTLERDSESLANLEIDPRKEMIPPLASSAQNLNYSWQTKLEAAQNVLFCREIFGQLTREVVHMETRTPPVIMGKTIVCSLFPKVKLCISLVHNTTASAGTSKSSDSSNKDKKIFIKKEENSNEGEDSKTSNPTKPSPTANLNSHKTVLEHSLHQLLREAHHNFLHHPMPHPTSAPVGASRRQHLAGPEALDRQTLREASGTKYMLEALLDQAAHLVLRWQVMKTIDSLAVQLKDPLIVPHWCSLSSPTKSVCRVDIVSHNYDALCKTHFVLQVGTRTLRAITKDARVQSMTYDMDELRAFILELSAQHQVLAVHSIGKILGWKTLCLSLHTSGGNGGGASGSVGKLLGGLGPDSGSAGGEGIAPASSILITAPNGSRTIAVRSGPQSGIRVYLSTLSTGESNGLDGGVNGEHDDVRYEALISGGDMREIDWARLEGKSLVQKMEHLLASLNV